MKERIIRYSVTIEHIKEKKGGILLPAQPYKEDLMMQIAFNPERDNKEIFLHRMEYMYDTMERAIKDRMEQLDELSR